MTFEELIEKARSVHGFRQLSPEATAGSVSAALETAQGHVYIGVCIDTACSLGFCAEHAAAAAMVTAGEHRVVRMVAVGANGAVLPPCGRCRELIRLLHPGNLETEVMVAPGAVVKLAELLPFDWRS
ncbi:cytidine deaminase family protein [Alicyclobacillus vulcanalis]|uniref:Cytidine deaminase n=1 Tax=Alicyclobacillus vulcanalis TaxID=252246 RepID=A0A1N7LPK7_9BACL|nr:cytidine deaminase [Alicyclobacillus vulcanalis]SIS75777.1 Cytidine deaminase [Alicyclobacillus vulcanalis]